MDRATDLREDATGVRADQTNGADYDHQYNGKHHRIFGYILAAFVAPETF
ncbi:MAG TPA: hypothetical protein VFA89_00740 [Terriglobales bacterium]|nr:hypothetical protein [Terriglobales bacterium]